MKNLDKIVLDTYTTENEVSMRVISRAIFGSQSICIINGDLFFGNKVVVGYNDYCSDYPALDNGDILPKWYVIRREVSKELNTDYASFVCGFDLLKDGQIWCGHLKTHYGCNKPIESKESFFTDMDKAVAHIDSILGVDNWNFFMEEPMG